MVVGVGVIAEMQRCREVWSRLCRGSAEEVIVQVHQSRRGRGGAGRVV